MSAQPLSLPLWRALTTCERVTWCRFCTCGISSGVPFCRTLIPSAFHPEGRLPTDVEHRGRDGRRRTIGLPRFRRCALRGSRTPSTGPIGGTALPRLLRRGSTRVGRRGVPFLHSGRRNCSPKGGALVSLVQVYNKMAVNRQNIAQGEKGGDPPRKVKGKPFGPGGP